MLNEIKQMWINTIAFLGSGTGIFILILLAIILVQFLLIWLLLWIIKNINKNVQVVTNAPEEK